MDRLQSYEALLTHWNARINLVGRNDLSHFWGRHIIDSAQLFTHAPHPGSWIDLGSGGGLPGIVCAIVAGERSPRTHFTLVESDERKSVFLNHAANHLGLKINVRRARIEALPQEHFDIISARALAPVKKLFSYADKFTHAQTTMLFLKGQNASRELTEASEDWHNQTETYPSLSDPSGKILKITKLQSRK